MFPPAGASIIRNEDGEPLGWDCHHSEYDDDPYYGEYENDSPFSDATYPDDSCDDTECNCVVVQIRFCHTCGAPKDCNHHPDCSWHIDRDLSPEQ